MAAGTDERFDHSTLDDALERRCLPVVKFYLPSGISRWVVVVGKSGLDYVARDPLDETREAVRLSQRPSQIHAFCCIRRLPASSR